MQHEWLEKCIHSPEKIVPAPLASEKKNALTNSSTIPLKGQMVHP